MAWKDREGWLNFIFEGDSKVEGEKERDEKRCSKSLWETGTWRIPCASQFTIPDMPGTSPDPACNYTDMSSSQPNQAIGTPDFPYPLVSSI